MGEFRMMDEPCIFQNCRQMVFCLLYCPAVKPYLNYEEFKNKPEMRDRIFPVLVQLLRRDGYIGNPGGFVDHGETDLITAILRELKEETNFSPTPERVNPLVSHINNENSQAIHCFECEISEKELMCILANQQKAKHYLAESTLFAVLIHDFDNDNGYRIYRKHQFKATAGVEVDFLVQKKGWLI